MILITSNKETNAYMPLCPFSPWPYGRQVLPSCYKYRPSSSPLSSVVCTSSKSTVTFPALSLSLARNQVEHYNMAKFAVSFHLNSFSYLCVALYIHFPYRVRCLLSSLWWPSQWLASDPYGGDKGYSPYGHPGSHAFVLGQIVQIR